MLNKPSTRLQPQKGRCRDFAGDRKFALNMNITNSLLLWFTLRSMDNRLSVFSILNWIFTWSSYFKEPSSAKIPKFRRCPAQRGRCAPQFYCNFFHSTQMSSFRLRASLLSCAFFRIEPSRTQEIADRQLHKSEILRSYYLILCNLSKPIIGRVKLKQHGVTVYMNIVRTKWIRRRRAVSGSKSLFRV